MNNRDLNRSRRNFLQFIGKTGIAAPALKGSTLLAGLLANRYAQASGGTKRVVFVYTPMGAPTGRWLPRDGKLNDCTQAYEGVQSLCHFREVYLPGGGFGLMQRALGSVRYTRDWTGDTIDHQLARVLGIATPFPSLHFGVQCFGESLDSFTRRLQQPILPMDDPAVAYERLFGAADGITPPHFTAVSRKANILDSHLQSLTCNYAKLSSEEIRTLDQYEAGLRSLGDQLAASGGSDAAPAACQRPSLSSQDLAVGGTASSSTGSFAAQARLQAEIISHAFACGLTNVATLQLSDEQGESLKNDFTVPGGMHQASCGGYPEVYAQMVNHLSGCVAYLVKQLMELDDPTVPGTKLIDNTVVLQVTNLGNGPDHGIDDAPNLLATRMPVFKTGVATPCAGRHESNLRVLQTVAVGLGLERYIGTESHHCIWPCGGLNNGVDPLLLA